VRVVLDTNVIVSSFLSAVGNPARIVAALEQERFEIVVSEALLAEYGQALSYPRVAHRHGMTPIEIAEVVDGFRIAAILVPLTDIPTVIRDDPDDDMVLATARAGEASYIVTGDAELQQLGEYEGIQILNPAVFLALLEGQTDGC
jgi:putative PIN family toxin of toxin-antitoxin system